MTILAAGSLLGSGQGSDPVQRLILSPLALCLALVCPAAVLAQYEGDVSGAGDIAPALVWQSLGPDRGGRVTAVEGTPESPLTFYAGTVGGGVLVTENAGTSWRRLSNRSFGSASIGAIAVAPSDPQTIYVGTGEATARMYMSTSGDGVYRTTDGGKSWQHLGLRETRRIGDILVHPKNPQVLYVAALGDAWQPSKSRGVFKSVDGGKTWQHILFVNDTTSAVNLANDPTDPDKIYVSLWDNIRSPHYLGSGGAGSGLMRSSDAGKTWARIDSGLPRPMGKVKFDVSPVDAQRIYALVEAEGKAGGLYRSDDGGASWSQTNSSRQLWTRSWYYMHVVADPVMRDRVYTLNFKALRSDDAGKTFSEMPTPHGDNHALWINPKDPDIMAQGNDGGATVSMDAGKSWSSLLNQRTGQFYRVSVDQDFPYNIYAAQQDWGTISLKGRPEYGGSAGGQPMEVGGGEAGFVVADPFDSNFVYAGSELGVLTRFDRRTGAARPISPQPLFPEGQDPSELRYRFDVNAPLVASKHKPGVLYFGAQYVFKSEDRGQSWREISPDLTLNRKAEQGRGGGPITNERIDAHNALRSIDESPLDGNVLWAASDDGLVHVSVNGGESWANVTPPKLAGGEVYTISASPHRRGTAYMAVARHKWGDYRPYYFRTDDYGKNWTSISATLPQETYARAIKADPVILGLLYGGTERGLYLSWNNGQNWQELSQSLPTASVTGIATAADDLVISTEGEGIWQLRGLSTLRQTRGHASPETQLFAPPPAHLIAGNVQGGLLPSWATAPQLVATIDLALSELDLKSADEIVVDIKDEHGKNVRRMAHIVAGRPQPLEASSIDDFNNVVANKAGAKVKSGVLRLNWDMRRESFIGVEDARDGRLTGSKVPPGKYTVEMRSGSRSWTKMLDVLADPRLPMPAAAEFARKEKFLREAEALFREISTAVNLSASERQRAGLEKARVQKLDAWEERLVSRRLEVSGGLDRVNFGGGLLYDIATLMAFADDAALPLAPSYAETLATLQRRWQELKKNRP
jgi:photosystem II stability/assembly factor-like uncharacterized protein